MKKILITGASGMLGASLIKALEGQYDVYGTGNSRFIDQPKRYKIFDLKSKAYNELIQWSNPEIIIHCAALTNGNYCEEHPEEALAINGLSVQKLLKATTGDCKIIYISTDAVFSQSIHLAKETDCVSPENIYGKSKELGEFFLNTTTNRDYTIIRTTIFGLNLNSNKIGFAEWIINSAKEQLKIGLFSDVLFTPISIWDLIGEIKFLIDSNNINSETLHIGGELCTKYDFGNRLLSLLNLPSHKISKSQISNFPDRAKRSNDQSIDSNFYFKKYRRNPINLEKGLQHLKRYYYEQDQTRQ